ncbi:uncharacterized protein BYT42DRAFT_496790, partial [Radiomyces spectabilis]|uniref:uncharacterized protein n=1 Tax=Radiomyces spectabilis TaxID=64574 RepID=UPI00221EAB85
GMGMRRMLKRQPFEVYLFSEYQTSSCCRDCGDPLKKFKRMKDPPCRITIAPQALYYALLRLPIKK